MNKGFDIAVIGGGGSGLSLLYALHLQGQLKHRRVAIIEPKSKDSNDRTWCFWTNGEDPAWEMFSPCVSKTWSHLEGPFEGQQALKPYRYAQIRSKDYYRFVHEALESYPDIEWFDSALESLKTGEWVLLKLRNGHTFSAEMVFDSRPPRLEDPMLIWQSFVGYRIKFKQEVNSAVCRIMDFKVPQKEGLQFMYWLPSSQSEALVEFTRFGREVLNEKEALPIIETYLKKFEIKEYTIVEKEIDKIPMTLKLNARSKYHSNSEQVIPIGSRAGAIKASSGFAFKYFCEHAWQIANSIKMQEPRLPQLHRPKRFKLYDELLMRLIIYREDIIKDLFEGLFRKNPVQRIFRFLDEKSHLGEELLIMYKSPWLPFFWSIKESLRERIIRLLGI